MRYNVLIFTCHDLGDYLGCYGTPVRTPNIDSLARDGACFDSHYSTATICSPARGSILTGCFPHTNGLMGLIHRGWALNVDKCETMVRRMSENGYDSHLFGFQHEHYDPKALGYAHVHAAQNRSTHCGDVVPMFESWLAGRDKTKPFYAAIGVSEVHRYHMNPSDFKYEEYPDDYTEAEVQVRPCIPDIAPIRTDLKEFYNAIQYMDGWFGRVLSALEREGLRDNTLVIFVTDHGASFIHCKATLYEGGTKVALLMRLPGAIQAGLRVKGLTSHVDILPTVCELTGVPAPDGVQGQSVAGFIGKDADGTTARTYAASEENVNNHFAPGRAVRFGRFRYIKNGLCINLFDFQIPEIELSRAGFRSSPEVQRFYDATRYYEELYDLEADPGERRNVAGDPAYADSLTKARAILAEHLEKTGDPFKDFKDCLPMPADGYNRLYASRSGK